MESLARPTPPPRRPGTGRWQPPRHGRGAARPFVSVIVPTHRRPELLQRCLDALRAQSLPAACYEIIVVDDGHCDATRARIQPLARVAGPAVRYLRPLQGRGPAAARNCGWRAARGPVVAFTDDDTVPARDWLAQGLAALRAGPWAGLGGRVVVPPLAPPPSRPTDHERMARGLETAAFVTANAFVRRAALEQVGGFDERFRRPWREDSDLRFRLQAEVGPVGRCEHAVVLHPVRPERWGLSLRLQQTAFFDALLYRKHRHVYRQSLRRVPPWDHYAVVGASAAAPPLAWGGAPGAAALCAALAAALVLALAGRRLAGASRAPAHVLEMLFTSALIPFLSVFWRLRGAWHHRVWLL